MAGNRSARARFESWRDDDAMARSIYLLRRKGAMRVRNPGVSLSIGAILDKHGQPYEHHQSNQKGVNKSVGLAEQ